MAITKINNLGITDGTIVNADISASAGIASTKLTGVNDAKAWVNFNGTGTPAIREDFNVTSITDNGTGLYTVNLTTAMQDTNYCSVLSGTDASGNTRAMGQSTVTTSSLAVVCNSFGGVALDFAFVNVAIFR